MTLTLPGGGTAPSGTVLPADTSRDLTLTAVLAPDRYSLTLGAAVPRTIPVSLGATEYVTVTVADATGAPLTASTFNIALGSYDSPGTWRTPDTVTHPSTSTAAVSMLVGASVLPAPGRYWAWVRVSDSLEVSPVRCTTAVTIS